jgi:hypothetical protein
MKPAALLLVFAAALGLCACERQIKAPSEAGVCYQAIFLSNGGVRFNKLSEHEATIEHCAASLEGMRLRFAAMGGADEIVGAYQGNYIFLFHEGIFRGDSLKGARFPMLVRFNGQLVAPGSIPQSAIDAAAKSSAH